MSSTAVFYEYTYGCVCICLKVKKKQFLLSLKMFLIILDTVFYLCKYVIRQNNLLVQKSELTVKLIKYITYMWVLLVFYMYS